MTDTAKLNDEVRDLWNAKAAYWDEQMGEGNLFHRVLIGPAVERLLRVRPGEAVLDVACGNGQIARRLAELGATVVACDFSQVFLDRAVARSADHSGRIDYRLLDATDAAQLGGLGEGRFDAVVCSMAIQDIVDIGPLFAAVPRLLKPGGRFVFAVPHPCFNSMGTGFLAEAQEVDGRIVTTHAVKVHGYFNVPAARGVGMPGEPAPHYYFQRTLSDLLGAAFINGMVLDGLEEPRFPADTPNQRPLNWTANPDIPPVLAGRLTVR